MSTACPLCNKANHCGTPTGPGCWCNEIEMKDIRKEVFRIFAERKLDPLQAQQNCLCLNCVEELKKKAGSDTKSEPVA